MQIVPMRDDVSKQNREAIVLFEGGQISLFFIPSETLERSENPNKKNALQKYPFKFNLQDLPYLIINCIYLEDGEIQIEGFIMQQSGV